METKVKHSEIINNYLLLNNMSQKKFCEGFEPKVRQQNFAYYFLQDEIKEEWRQKIKEVYKLDLDDPAAPVSTIFERSAPHGGSGGDDCEQKKEALKKELAEKNQVIELQNITIQSLQLNIQLLKEKLSIK